MTFSIILLGCSDPQSQLERTRFKSLLLRSSGEVQVLPDKAQLRISLNCLNKNINISKECLIEKSNSLTERILKYKVAKEDILTSSIDLSKRHTWIKNTYVFKGYDASTSMLVTINDLEILEDLYTDLLQDQNLEIGSLSYSHSQYDSLKNAAYMDALDNVNRLADGILLKVGADNKEIIQISNKEITATMPNIVEYCRI